MKFSLRKKIFLFVLFLLFIVTVAASFISAYELQRYYKARIYEQLQTQLDQIDFLLAHNQLGKSKQGIDYDLLADYARVSQLRLTLIDSVGIVLFDSNVAKDSLVFLENHLSRPEIKMAMEKGIGSNQRHSKTIDEDMFYVAKCFDPTVVEDDFLQKVRFVRVAIPLQEVNHVLRVVQWKIFGAGGIALLVIAFISYWTSNKLTYPIHRLTQVAESVKKSQLDAHFDHISDDEIGELADLLNEMLDKLRADLIQLRKLEKMRSQFLGNVSHELRTPIFAVQGYLETLLHLDECDPETQRNFTRKAYNQAVRLNNLLTDLIDISRIESGEMKMSFSEFPIQEWLSKLVNDLTGTAQENKVELVFTGNSTNSDTMIVGDRERLSQVMINLVENAIKYNTPGGKVEIGFRDYDQKVEIFVRDSGRGIPEEHLPRIFERFYRVDKERSRSVGGTGLGLAIVKHIIEAHGSRIDVESQVGKGSTFRFRLNKA